MPVSVDKKIEILNRLKQKAERCRRCPLWETRKKIVLGGGSPNSKILFVSEAPGYWEDQRGVPFCGRAGKLLDELLTSINLKREQIYIANVIKCRPPKNRKPTKEEIKACLPYLKKQIKIINPQKFILLGEVAFSVFFPKDYPSTSLPLKLAPKLKNFRGKWIKKDRKEYFITYHPAAGMRFPRIKKILEKDFQKLKNTFRVF